MQADAQADAQADPQAATPAAELIPAAGCALVLVDYQARLMPAIHEGEAVAARALLMAQAAQALGLPVLGTEQNPDKLGPNLPAITERCTHTLAKMHFNACADGLLAAVQAQRPRGNAIVIAGCEAHVCLLQTALGLLQAGQRLWVVENACGSRRPDDHRLAMQRLAQAGAVRVSHEMVLFEWLRSCEHPAFRELLPFIKACV